MSDHYLHVNVNKQTDLGEESVRIIIYIWQSTCGAHKTHLDCQDKDQKKGNT